MAAWSGLRYSSWFSLIGNKLSGGDTTKYPFCFIFPGRSFKLVVIAQQIYFRYQQGLTRDERFASMPAKIQMILHTSLHAAQTGRL
jgi:hypothetical protein